MSPVDPPRWSDNQFEKDRKKAIQIFRQQRMQEPLAQYLKAFEAGRDAIDKLLETTVDLTTLFDKAVEVLTDKHLLRAVRYLPGPPISEDDLKTLADDVLFTPTRRWLNGSSR